MDFMNSIAQILKVNHEKQENNKLKSDTREIIFVISNQYLIPEYKKTIHRKNKKTIKYIND